MAHHFTFHITVKNQVEYMENKLMLSNATTLITMNSFIVEDLLPRWVKCYGNDILFWF